eukprot:scaffold67770_cov82-Phaeocystis_antarctica.AAC.1
MPATGGATDTVVLLRKFDQPKKNGWSSAAFTPRSGIHAARALDGFSRRRSRGLRTGTETLGFVKHVFSSKFDLCDLVCDDKQPCKRSASPRVPSSEQRPGAVAGPRPVYPLLPDTGRVGAAEHQLRARPPLRLGLERTADGRQVERQRPQLVDVARHRL